MNENLNLVEILKDCPKGTKLYSTVYGEVKFNEVDMDATCYPIEVLCNTHNNILCLTKEGYIYPGYPDCECTLFPSKDQRDWSKWKCPKPDLPIDTPMMVSSEKSDWRLRYYAGYELAWGSGNKSTDKDRTNYKWRYIIPFNKFNPNDIEGSLKYNIVGNGE